MSDQTRSQLQKAIASEADATKILQLSDRHLAHSTGTDKVFGLHCKAVALMRMSKFELVLPLVDELVAEIRALHQERGNKEMLEALKAGPPPHIGFLAAQAHYKLGAFDKALDCAASCVKHHEQKFPKALPPADLLNVMAQCHYNMEQFSRAASIYESILESQNFRDDVERDEVVTNLTAAYAAQADCPSCVASSKRTDVITVDILFNLATAHAQAKRYAEALKLLNDAEKLVLDEHAESSIPKKSFEELCAEMKKVTTATAATAPFNFKLWRAYLDEIVAVKVQQALCNAALGNIEASEATLNATLQLSERPSAVATYAVACLNWTALRRHDDFFDSMKKLQHLRTPQVDKKLTTTQRLFVKYNMCLVLLGIGGHKIQQCRQLAEQMCRDCPGSELGPMAMSSVLLQEQKRKGGSGGRSAEDYLRSFLNSNREAGNSGTQLILAQLCLERGDVNAALERVSSAGDLVHRPAVVATLAEGLARNGEVTKAVELVGSEVSKYGSSATVKAQQAFWTFASSFYARYRQYKAAAHAFEQLIAVSGSSATPEQTKEWIASIVLVLGACQDAQGSAKWSAKLGAGEQAARPVAASDADLPKKAIEAAGYLRAASTLQDEKVGRKLLKDARKRPARHLPKHIVMQRNYEKAVSAAKAAGETAPAAPPASALLPSNQHTGYSGSMKIDPERWLPMRDRSYVKDLGSRRLKELKRRRGEECNEKKRARERARKKALEAAAAEASQ